MGDNDRLLDKDGNVYEKDPLGVYHRRIGGFSSGLVGRPAEYPLGGQKTASDGTPLYQQGGQMERAAGECLGELFVLALELFVLALRNALVRWIVVALVAIWLLSSALGSIFGDHGPKLAGPVPSRSDVTASVTAYVDAAFPGEYHLTSAYAIAVFERANSPSLIVCLDFEFQNAIDNRAGQGGGEFIMDWKGNGWQTNSGDAFRNGHITSTPFDSCVALEHSYGDEEIQLAGL